MEKIFSTLSKLIPIIGGCVYVLGFIVYQSFLNKHGFRDKSLLNFQYLSTGILFCFIYIPVILAIVSERYLTIKMKYSKFKAMFASLFIILIHTSTLGYILFDFTFNNNAIYLALFILLVLIELYFENTSKKIGKILTYALLITGALFVIYKTEQLGLILGSFMILWLLIGRSLEKFNDKESISIMAILLTSFFLVGLSYLFGVSALEKIPSYYGGTQTPYSTLVIKEQYNSQITKISKNIVKEYQIDSVQIVHQNQNFLYLSIKDSICMTIPKEIIIAQINIKQDK
jgi:hypothetical protein